MVHQPLKKCKKLQLSEVRRLFRNLRLLMKMQDLISHLGSLSSKRILRAPVGEDPDGQSFGPRLLHLERSKAFKIQVKTSLFIRH